MKLWGVLGMWGWYLGICSICTKFEADLCVFPAKFAKTRKLNQTFAYNDIILGWKAHCDWWFKHFSAARVIARLRSTYSNLAAYSSIALCTHWVNDQWGALCAWADSCCLNPILLSDTKFCRYIDWRLALRLLGRHNMNTTRYNFQLRCTVSLHQRRSFDWTTHL